MSFKLKYKPEDGPEVELDFEQIEQSGAGLLLIGEDKNTGRNISVHLGN